MSARYCSSSGWQMNVMNLLQKMGIDLRNAKWGSLWETGSCWQVSGTGWEQRGCLRRSVGSSRQLLLLCERYRGGSASISWRLPRCGGWKLLRVYSRRGILRYWGLLLSIRWKVLVHRARSLLIGRTNATVLLWIGKLLVRSSSIVERWLSSRELGRLILKSWGLVNIPCVILGNDLRIH